MDDKRRRESILSVAAKWLPWCLGLVFALTIGWAIFVASVEIASREHDSGAEVVVAVAINTAAVLPLIILCSLFATTMFDILGGAIMVTARYLTEKFLEPWREKMKAEAKAQGLEMGKAQGLEMGKAQGLEMGKAQGKAQGLAQKQQEWEIWLRSKEEAEERDEPFDDPPPSL